jgi:outer membrane receptor protein involved in Fe transport
VSRATWPRALGSCLALVLAVPAIASAQDGAIGGRVRDSTSGAYLADVSIAVEEARRGTVTDASGTFRIRQVRSGTYTVLARRIGYQPTAVRNVVVRSGETTSLTIVIVSGSVELDELAVEAGPTDPLDALSTRTEQRYTAEDLRNLPISSLDEALTLSAGAVGTSYRGGRPGEQSFILDGLGVKNQLDASTNQIGLRIPTDILTEATLVTNGFSAKYGQAISGMVNVVTTDGGPKWTGRVAYESDRLLTGPADLGLDRLIVSGSGPIVAGIHAVFGVDLNARIDFDPTSAPPPDDPEDPRHDIPAPLPHNAGQQLSYAGKLIIPAGRGNTVRLFGLYGTQQQTLYDQLYKYDLGFAPGLSFSGTLLSAGFQHTSSPTAKLPMVIDARAGYFDRNFVRGQLADSVNYFLGAFTTSPFNVVGEEIARAKDTIAAQQPIPGMYLPDYSSRSPWGVPAFFQAQGTEGSLDWNSFSELRGQLDVTIGLGTHGDLLFGGEYISQRVQTFQRVLGYLPVGDSVPPATASDFSPSAASLYLEGQYRVQELGFTAGLRYDQFNTQQEFEGIPATSQRSLNPRLAASTVLKGFTIVSSFGYFSQAPDYQYLVNSAFDDVDRTGRFRIGNPNLGFERAWQFEFNVRVRPAPNLLLRTGVYVRKLYGLVSSVPQGFEADSSIFSNTDYGSVRGFEAIFERALVGGWGLRLLYTLQFADANSSNAFLVRSAYTIDPATGDTIIPGQIEFPFDYDRRHALTAILQGAVSPSVGPTVLGSKPFARWQGSLIVRLLSGLPYTPVDPQLEIPLPPNSARLPWTNTIDMLIRRPLQIGPVEGSIYFDVRNLLGRQNLVSVRPETGTPYASTATIDSAVTAAYEANPQPIPYESPRYRASADLNHDGLVAGPDELLPLYRKAARDYFWPVFFYGPPRAMRFGVEVLF